MLAGIISFLLVSRFTFNYAFFNALSFHYVTFSMIHFNFWKAVGLLYPLGGCYVHFLCKELLEAFDLGHEI